MTKPKQPHNAPQPLILRKASNIQLTSARGPSARANSTGANSARANTNTTPARSYANLLDRLYAQVEELLTEIAVSDAPAHQKADAISKVARSLPLLKAAERVATVRVTNGKAIEELTDEELNAEARRVLGGTVPTATVPAVPGEEARTVPTPAATVPTAPGDINFDSPFSGENATLLPIRAEKMENGLAADVGAYPTSIDKVLAASYVAEAVASKNDTIDPIDDIYPEGNTDG